MDAKLSQEAQAILKSELFKGLYDIPIGSAIDKLIVDGLASGLPGEIIQRHYLTLTGFDLPREELFKQAEKNADRIMQRRNEMREEIEKFGFVNIATDTILRIQDDLQEERSGEDRKNYIALLNTLKGYLEFFISKKDERKPEMHIGTVNVQVNNYEIIQWLADDGIIEVKDHAKLKRTLGIKDGQEHSTQE